MARDLYENSQDRKSEKSIRSHLKVLGCGLLQTSMSYKLDYSIYRNDDLVGWAEVKCRTQTLEHFPHT